jgi:LEA14-like dessication related protein
MPLILQAMRQLISGYSTLKWAPLAILLWTSGCRAPLAAEYYGFQDLQVSGISGGKTALSAKVKLYNPNPYSLSVRRAAVDVSINGKLAGHSELDSTLFVPRKDTFYVPLVLQLDLKAVFSNALQMLLNNEATISLDGRVKIRRGLLTFKRPFHYDGKQDLKSLLPAGSGF